MTDFNDRCTICAKWLMGKPRMCPDHGMQGIPDASADSATDAIRRHEIVREFLFGQFGEKSAAEEADDKEYQSQILPPNTFWTNT